MSWKLLTSALLLVVLRISANTAPKKNCLLSHYKELDSTNFRELRDKYETVRGPDMNCTTDSASAKIFLRKWKKQLSDYQKLLLLKEDVYLTIQVLRNLSNSDPNLATKTFSPLETLNSFQKGLRSCIQLNTPNHEVVTQQPNLIKLLQRSHTRKSQVSAGCLEGSVIFNLLWLLEDVKKVACKMSPTPPQ